MNIERVLERYGLSPKEAQVYIAALALGTSPVQKISNMTSLPRSTCYEVLDTLKTKGLMSSFQKKRVRYFSAEDPHTLVDLAYDRAKLLEHNLPQLLALYATSKNRPTVRFYEGAEVAKLLFREVAEEATDNIGFSSADDIVEVIADDLEAFIKKRKEKKIPSKIIMRDTPQARAMQARDREELREIRLTDGAYEHHNLVLVWNAKIAILLLKKKLSAFIIESEELAQFHRVMFEMVWRTLPPSPTTHRAS
jgi:sugar-specific transcriptional regulator TrmB